MKNLIGKKKATQRTMYSVIAIYAAILYAVWAFIELTEEMVFRGWLLNAMSFNRKGFVPVMINAIMFLLIHFPVWIRSGIFMSTFTSFGFISIIALGIIFSVCLLRSRNILVPMVLHSFWDI